MNRYDFSKAEVARALSGENVPNFMNRFAFKKKDGKLFFEGREVIPNEERDTYLRKILYDDNSTLPFGRDSLFYVLKKKVINISKRYIERFLKAQNVIVKRTARPKKENRKFVSTIKKAGVVSADLAHIEPKDLPDGFMPRQEEESDEEYVPGQDNKPKWGRVKKTYYMYNVVDKMTGYLVTEVVHSKNENLIAKATKRLLSRMARALNTPVRAIEWDQGTEFNKAEKELQALKRPNSVTVKRMRTNALVESVNAKVQRIFYTVAKQRRTGFKGTMVQAVKISNNTLNRKLGMTPNEAVQKLKSGEPLKRRQGRHPKPILKKHAYKVGAKVRAIKKAREKVTHHKAYKGKHWGPVQTITRVVFYQGYPRYELDNKRRTKESVDVDTDEDEEEKQHVVDPNKKKKTKPRGVSLLKWHDQLSLAQDVDQKSKRLVSSREIVTWEKQTFRPGMLVWLHVGDKKQVARVKTKIADGWRVRYKDGTWKLRGVEPKDIEPLLKAGTQVWWKTDGEKYKALVKATRGKDMFIKFRKDNHNYQKTVPETELIPR